MMSYIPAKFRKVTKIRCLAGEHDVIYVTVYCMTQKFDMTDLTQSCDRYVTVM